MNKESYDQIIDDAYKNYLNNWKPIGEGPIYINPLSKEEFINRIKTNPKFSEKWGIKIEERELSLEERMILCKEKWDYSWNRTINLEDIEWRMNNEWNTPTRLITLTYNNETIEFHFEEFEDQRSELQQIVDLAGRGYIYDDQSNDDDSVL